MDAAVAKCSEYRPLFAVPILQHKRRLTDRRGTPEQLGDQCVACMGCALHNYITPATTASHEACRTNRDMLPALLTQNWSASCTTSHSRIHPAIVNHT